MNLNKILSIVLVASILYLIYFLITNPSKDHRQNASILFQEITNKDIDKLSIIIDDKKGYSYYTIQDKIVIKEFVDALKRDTFIPKMQAGHHMYTYVITLHNNTNSNLILLRSDSIDKGISNDSVDITLFEVENIDILKIYYKSLLENKDFFNIFTPLYGYGKYYLRNHELYNVLNKYIKGKGLKYNPTSKKWTKN